MKHTPELPNTDPTAVAGNRKIRPGRPVATALAAALLLSGCSWKASRTDAAPSRAPASTSAPESVKPPVSTEQKKLTENEQIKLKAQATAEDFAGRIMTEYAKGKSSDNNLFEPTDGPGLQGVFVNYDAETSQHNATGEYVFTAIVGRDEKGNPNPAAVNNIYLAKRVYTFDKNNPSMLGKSTTLHSFSLEKHESTNDWSIGVINRTNKGEIKGGEYDTVQTPGANQNGSITMEHFDAYIEQAKTVFDQAVNQTPIDVVPPVVNQK